MFCDSHGRCRHNVHTIWAVTSINCFHSSISTYYYWAHMINNPHLTQPTRDFFFFRFLFELSRENKVEITKEKVVSYSQNLMFLPVAKIANGQQQCIIGCQPKTAVCREVVEKWKKKILEEKSYQGWQVGDDFIIMVWVGILNDKMCDVPKKEREKKKKEREKERSWKD